MKLTSNEITILSEMFPQYSPSYFVSISDSFSSLPSLINHLLTPSTIIEMNLEEALYNFKKPTRAGQILVKIPERQYGNKNISLHYPEVYEKYYEFDNNFDISNIRKDAQDLFMAANRTNDSLLKSGYIEKAIKMNRIAVILIIRRMFKRVKKGTIDLHGLEAKECLMFLDDYHEHVETVITGNSKRIKPIVKEYFVKKGYVVNEFKIGLHLKEK